MLSSVLLLQISPPVDIFALAYDNPVIDAISYGYKTENTFSNLSTKLIHFRTHSNKRFRILRCAINVQYKYCQELCLFQWDIGNFFFRKSFSTFN
jgi:hypothetical protein